MNSNVKQGIFLVLKILGLTLAMFIGYILSSQLVGMGQTSNISPQLAQAQVWSLFLMCLLHTIVLSFYVLKANIHGWRLAGIVFLIYFGITTFLSQIESVVFLKYLVSITSIELIGKIFIHETMLSILVSLLLVWILNKFSNHSTDPDQTTNRFNFSWPKWIGKFALICVIYVVIYFGFGYFVAWQSPDVQKFYAGLKLPDWMIFFQFFRAIVWGLIALLIMKTMTGKVWQVGLATALLFSVLMGSGLILPDNPVMPDAVRFAHFKEIMTSNFLFGWLTVWILNFGSMAVSYRHKTKREEEIL